MNKIIVFMVKWRKRCFDLTRLPPVFIQLRRNSSCSLCCAYTYFKRQRKELSLKVKVGAFFINTAINITVLQLHYSLSSMRDFNDIIFI